MVLTSRYETSSLLEQYLLFHYGEDQDLMPFSFGPKNSLHFPTRIISECLNLEMLPQNAKALDLGCAVGRSSFELAKHCKSVIAIDNSHLFISAAKQIQKTGLFEYEIKDEGIRRKSCVARLPEQIDVSRVEFLCADAMEQMEKCAKYDVVLVANLICRLPKPFVFLSQLAALLNPGGQLIIASPYSWLEEFTSSAQWLGKENRSTLETIREILGKDFELELCLDLPFLQRQHLRKYEWVVTQTTVWTKL